MRRITEQSNTLVDGFTCEAGDIPDEKAFRVADFNGDGLDDLLCHERSGTINILFNTFSELLHGMESRCHVALNELMITS